MYQSSSSYDILNMYHYKTLCKLYSRYKHALKIALENTYEDYIADPRICEVDHIMQEIEKYPVSWDFYMSQDTQFSSDFENLIIFSNEVNI